jgi:threonine/homoserine/homoserine lactone efflux protein
MNETTLIMYLFQGAALGFTAAFSPGPFQTYLVSETLSGGWRRSVLVAFAPLISDLPIIVLSLFLLNQLPEYFLRIIGLAGGIFVLYLAWRLWNNWREGNQVFEQEESYRKSSLWRGVMVNFLGPGPYLFWALVSGPILLSALNQSIAAGISFLAGFYGVMIIALLGIVLLFDKTRRLGAKVVRSLLLISIIILIIFGGILLTQAIRG